MLSLDDFEKICLSHFEIRKIQLINQFGSASKSQKIYTDSKPWVVCNSQLLDECSTYSILISSTKGKIN